MFIKQKSDVLASSETKWLLDMECQGEIKIEKKL